MSAPSEQMVPALPRPLPCTPSLREAAQTDGERVVSRHAKHHHRRRPTGHTRDYHCEAIDAMRIRAVKAPFWMKLKGRDHW
jgi:hypothetical protein